MQEFKFHSKLIIFVLILAGGGIADAQLKKSPKLKLPLLTIELLGSYNAPVQGTAGEVSDFFEFKNYGTNAGFGGQLNWKLATNKKGTIRPYLTMGYAQFQNEDNNYAYIDSNRITGGYPLDSTKSGSRLSQYLKIKGRSELFLRMGYAGLGIEYAWPDIDRRRRFIPFVGLDATVSVIWGLYRQEPDDPLYPGAPDQEISFTIKPGVRFGLGINAGAQYRLADAFGLMTGVHYRWANIIGKSSRRTKALSQDINDENKMEPLDDGDTRLNPLLTDSRDIGYFEIYFGFAFYIWQ